MRRLLIIGQGVAVIVLVWLSATAMEKVTVFLSSCVTCLVIVGLTLAWLGWAAVTKKPLRPALTAASLALFVVASVIFTDWPLRLSYVLSRPALQRLAQSVQEGQQPNGPVRIGLFVIRQAEVSRQGTICLWTEVDPSGNTGFVQCDAKNLPLNLWSSIPLDEQWSFVAED
jgi:hypothetical protein